MQTRGSEKDELIVLQAAEGEEEREGEERERERERESEKERERERERARGRQGRQAGPRVCHHCGLYNDQIAFFRSLDLH